MIQVKQASLINPNTRSLKSDKAVKSSLTVKAKTRRRPKPSTSAIVINRFVVVNIKVRHVVDWEEKREVKRFIQILIFTTNCDTQCTVYSYK